MEPRLTIITLGVKDLTEARKFYQQGLGLPTKDPEDSPIVFFNTSGTRIALYPLEKLSEDINPNCPPQGSGFGGITLAHNVRQKQDVDQLLSQAVRAGATLLKPAQDTFWGGYSGYFSDPDGYVWEVAWSENFQFDETGAIILH